MITMAMRWKISVFKALLHFRYISLDYFLEERNYMCYSIAVGILQFKNDG